MRITLQKIERAVGIGRLESSEAKGVNSVGANCFSRRSRLPSALAGSSNFIAANSGRIRQIITCIRKKDGTSCHLLVFPSHSLSGAASKDAGLDADPAQQARG